MKTELCHQHVDFLSLKDIFNLLYVHDAAVGAFSVSDLRFCQCRNFKSLNTIV